MMIEYNSLSEAMNNYNQINGTYFSILDKLIIDAIISNAYTTDRALSRQFICSERTIKRSINKLCVFGFIIKHLSYDNTKSLELNHTALNTFIIKYSGGEINA